MVIEQRKKAVDEKVLSAGIRDCKAFIVSTPGEKKLKYYYGGGFYDEIEAEIALQVDYIRPLFRKFSARNIQHVMFDGSYCDVLFSSGAWLCGTAVERVIDPQCDYLSRRFTDERVLINYGDITVVNMLLLQPEVSAQNSLYSIHAPSDTILQHPNPLTFAYVKEQDEIRIGYWDMVANKLVGETEKMEIPLLDKSG